MQQIIVHANAKINLSLDVINRRADGYHNVRMVMQSLSLHDTLTILKTEQPGIQISAINAERFPDVTWDENNLVYKAAKLWFETHPSTEGVHIIVDKQIPSAAGLAGGSSDAAATLKGLNVLFEQGASISELQALGVKLGADIPYCIMGGTALAEGIGEQLTALPDAPACSCLIVKPNFHLSTKLVYENLTLDDPSAHPDIDAMLEAIHTNNYKKMTSSIGNILETVSIRLHPEIDAIKKEMLELGADCSLMSGSGPSVFGLFEHRQVAERAYRKFRLGPYGKQTKEKEVQSLCRPGD